jgi:hypothetical protein
MGKSRNYDREFRLIDKLKHENKVLKKELSRLTKELVKTNSRYEGLDDLVQQQYEEEYPDTGARIAKEAEDSKWMCHKCNNDILKIIILNRADGTYYFRKCGSCPNKTKLQRYNDHVKGVKLDDKVGKKSSK